VPEIEANSNGRDIKFSALSGLDWSIGKAGGSTERVWKFSLSHAQSAVDWYLDHRFHETGLMHGIHLASEAL